MRRQFIKVSLFVAVLISYTSFNAQAQTKVWSIGPELGVNISKLRNDNLGVDAFKPGLLTGLFLTYSVQNTFGITGKILYSVKGYDIGPKVNLNYIEIPVVARFFLNKEGKVRPNIFVGPSLGFLTGVTTKDPGGKVVKTDNYKTIFNTFDFGVTGGLGFNFLVAHDTYLILDARYTQGLADVSKGGGNVSIRPLESQPACPLDCSAALSCTIYI